MVQSVRRSPEVIAAYDAVATAYADELIDELDRKPFDRWLLERVAAMAAGPVADVGCGPGQTTAHLAMAGAHVTGFDLAPGMVAEARRRFPDVRFDVADLADLPGRWAAITAWYSLVHLAPADLPAALTRRAQVLFPAVAVHVGTQDLALAA